MDDPLFQGPFARRRGAPQGKIFIVAETDRKEAFVGQQIFLKVRLYTQLPVENLSGLEQPDLKGFWVEEMPQPKQLTGIRTLYQGEKYTVYDIRRAALFATRPGDLEIGSMSWEMGVAESDFFFSTVKRIARRTQPVIITVKPLPEKAKPFGYRGAVGTFGIEGAAQPSTVKVNNAVTLTVRIKGVGNLKTVEEPGLPELADFKTYGSKSSEDIKPVEGIIQGTKTWEYVLVPKAPGEQVIPPIKLPYFDPEKGQYETAATGEIRILVEKDGGEGGFVAAAPEVAKQEIRLVKEGINYIRLDLGKVRDPSALPLPGRGCGRSSSRLCSSTRPFSSMCGSGAGRAPTSHSAGSARPTARRARSCAPRARA